MTRRLAVLRVLVASYAGIWILIRAPHLLDTTDLSRRRFDPIGPLWFLGGPVPSALVIAAVVVTPIACLAMAVGWRYRWTAPSAAVGFLFLTTYRNSWGQIFHTENLVALHIVVLALAPAAATVWAVGSRPSGEAPEDKSRWAVDALGVLTVGTYFVAGVAKLRISGMAWIDGDVLRHQIAFDNARKELLGDTTAPFAATILRQSWLLGPAAILTMIVELAAPLALVHRRLATLWAALVLAFHFAILGVMAILFPYHLLGFAFAPLLPVERLGTAFGGRHRVVAVVER